MYHIKQANPKVFTYDFVKSQKAFYFRLVQI